MKHETFRLDDNKFKEERRCKFSSFFISVSLKVVPEAFPPAAQQRGLKRVCVQVLKIFSESPNNSCCVVSLFVVSFRHTLCSKRYILLIPAPRPPAFPLCASKIKSGVFLLTANSW